MVDWAQNINQLTPQMPGWHIRDTNGQTEGVIALIYLYRLNWLTPLSIWLQKKYFWRGSVLWVFSFFVCLLLLLFVCLLLSPSVSHSLQATNSISAISTYYLFGGNGVSTDQSVVDLRWCHPVLRGKCAVSVLTWSTAEGEESEVSSWGLSFSEGWVKWRVWPRELSVHSLDCLIQCGCRHGVYVRMYSLVLMVAPRPPSDTHRTKKKNVSKIFLSPHFSSSLDQQYL